MIIYGNIPGQSVSTIVPGLWSGGIRPLKHNRNDRLNQELRSKHRSSLAIITAVKPHTYRSKLNYCTAHPFPMHICKSLLSALFLGAGVLGAPTELVRRTSRTSAPSGCLTVGSSGKYTTIGAAITALGSSSEAACIYVASGTYKEQITINYAGALTIYGQTTDTGSYKNNVVTITHTISSPEAGSLDKSATVNVVSDGFKMYNINVVNGYGKGVQAVA